MKEKDYQNVLNYFNNSKKRAKMMTLLCKILPIIPFICYGILIFILIFHQDQRLFPCLIIPTMDFLFVSIIRKKINAKRPFEIYAIKPLIAHSLGESCPSRHSSSAFIIAFTWFFIYKPIGIFLILVSLLFAISRVLAGVHFIKDVTLGMFISILFSLLFIL